MNTRLVSSVFTFIKFSLLSSDTACVSLLVVAYFYFCPLN
jgi:hypothetical protein